MTELNHILRGEDLLSGSKGPTSAPSTEGKPLVFDVRCGGLFKIDSAYAAQNIDREQILAWSLQWNQT